MSDHVERIKQTVVSLWSPETSTLPERWNNRTPRGRAIGQGIVSALVLRDWLGGHLVRCDRATGKIETLHVYNSLDNGVTLDITTFYRCTDTEILLDMRPTTPAILLRAYEQIRSPYQTLGNAMMRALSPELPPFALGSFEPGVVMAAPNQVAVPPRAS